MDILNSSGQKLGEARIENNKAIIEENKARQEEIDSRKDYCICEITDSLYVYQTTLGNGIIQEKDGGASVTYNSESTTNNAQMLNIFGSYFDYYRGG